VLDYRHARALHRGVRRFAAVRPVSWFFARTMHHLDRPVSRWTGGRHTLTSALTGLTVAMLTTTGARSGVRRTLPVLTFASDGALVVIASNFAQGHHPGWYYNLLAHPEVELLVDGAIQQLTATLASGEQRARVWEQAVTIYPGWRAYAAREPGREIGVFLLTGR
jgi:deazaflavin-dependent oxidoreductase (nitroreductase family)